MPRLTAINRVYPPDAGATGQLLADLMEAAVGWGIEATVIAPGDPPPFASPASDPSPPSFPSRELPAAPGHPTSDLRPPTSDSPLPSRESLGGSAPLRESSVRVVRVGGRALDRRSLWRRAWSYVGLYPRLWAGLVRERSDVLLSITDPPLQVLLSVAPGVRASRRVHWAQDIYPEVAEELGVFRRGGVVARLVRALSTWALKRQDVIVAVGRCMKDRLVERGIDPTRIVVIPNWAHLPGEEGGADTAGFRAEQGWGDRPVIMYSGNFGMAHPFETIVAAAKTLAVTHPAALFAFVGGGPRESWLREATSGCPNVQFLPYQPASQLRASLGSADVHLASMEANLSGLVVPSKVAGVLGVGRPCCFLGPRDSEAARQIDESGAGHVFAPTDAAGLTAALQRLCDDAAWKAELHARAAAHAPRLARKAACEAFRRVLG